MTEIQRDATMRTCATKTFRPAMRCWFRSLFQLSRSELLRRESTYIGLVLRSPATTYIIKLYNPFQTGDKLSQPHVDQKENQRQTSGRTFGLRHVITHQLRKFNQIFRLPKNISVAHSTEEIQCTTPKRSFRPKHHVCGRIHTAR